MGSNPPKRAILFVIRAFRRLFSAERSDFCFDIECVLCFNVRCDIIALQSLLCIDEKENFVLIKKGHSRVENAM